MTISSVKGIYENYTRLAGRETLSTCYAKPSIYKKSAFNDCISDKVKHKGYNGKVVSYNTFMFTYGYQYDVVDNETGEITDTRFVYITPTNRYDISV